MKKFLLTIALIVCAFIYVEAQPRAVGANIGFGISASYQHNLSEANFLDIAIDVPGFNAIGVSCTYDWVNPFNTSIPWAYEGSWNWSLGVGAGAGFGFGGWGYAGVVGHCGVAYDFEFPLQLSVDYRPNIGAAFGNGWAGFYGDGLFAGITLGVRYRF